MALTLKYLERNSLDQSRSRLWDVRSPSRFCWHYSCCVGADQPSPFCPIFDIFFADPNHLHILFQCPSISFGLSLFLFAAFTSTISFPLTPRPPSGHGPPAAVAFNLIYIMVRLTISCSSSKRNIPVFKLGKKKSCNIIVQFGYISEKKWLT